jgi:hypothetical protein
MARFQKQQLSAGIILAILIALALMLCGCALPFDRTYSVNYSEEERDQRGEVKTRKIGAGVTFGAVQTKTDAKTVKQLER